MAISTRVSYFFINSQGVSFCQYYNTPEGCRRGNTCGFVHSPLAVPSLPQTRAPSRSTTTTTTTKQPQATRPPEGKSSLTLIALFFFFLTHRTKVQTTMSLL